MQQHPTGFNGIERELAQKSIQMEVWVQEKEIGKRWFQGSYIPDGLIFIGRI